MNELFIDVLDGREIGVLDRVLLDVRYRMEFASLLRMGQIHSGRHPRFLLFRLFNARFFSNHTSHHEPNFDQLIHYVISNEFFGQSLSI